MIPFPKDKLNQVIEAIDRELESLSGPATAAFDADGTLWAIDAGENMFKYQAEKKLLPHLPKNPWDHYLSMHKSSPPQAFLWLAQINQGQSLEQVRDWAKESLEAQKDFFIFEAQKEIISHLLKRNVTVYIVTASVKWAVEPAAELLGLPYDQVIGVHTETREGLVTDIQEGPITWREGKVEGLLEKTKNQKPFFAAGNTEGDLPLLELATRLRLVKASAQPGETNYETEGRMLDLAQKRDWFYHSYYPRG